MFKYILGVTALLAAVSVATATFGVDVSQLGGLSTFRCLKNEGFSFAIPRVRPVIEFF